MQISMQLVSICFGFIHMASSAVLAVDHPSKNDVAFLGVNSSSSKCTSKAGAPKGHGYGKHGCPCVGIDNMRGYFAANLDYHHVQYPVETGASCNNWEKSVHPECRDEPMPNWCRQSWCYVDPCNCDLEVLPKRTEMGVTYQGNPAYYSYNTCDDFDFWTESKVPHSCVLQKDSASCSRNPDCAWNGKQCGGKEAIQSCAKTQTLDPSTYGQDDCRCIGFGGRKNGRAVMVVDGKQVSYDANVGSTCGAWEQDAHPECGKDAPDGLKPAFCSLSWCYVDPCKCSIAVPPRAVSSANADQNFQGKTAYWSYETCGSHDESTDKLQEESCAIHTFAETCNKMDKCTWTGKSCSDKAIEQLCKDGGVLDALKGDSLPMRPIMLLAVLASWISLF